jgi:ACT domain-containing protein
MIMIVEIPEDLENMHKIADEFDELGKEQALRIHFMHEDIFNAMHTI